MTRIGLNLLKLLLIIMSSSTAFAYCPSALSIVRTGDQGAQYLLRNSDFVGLGLVVQPLDESKRQPEIISVLKTIKGKTSERLITLANPFQNVGEIEVSDAASSFGVAKNSIVVFALNKTKRGLIISSCTISLLNSLLMVDIYRSLLK